MILQEYRCHLNNKLLCKAAGQGQLEIMNPSNRIMNYVGPSRKAQDIGPVGIDFQRYSVDLNCKHCGRLQGRALGTDLQVEIKCRYCKQLSFFDLKEMKKKQLAAMSENQRIGYLNEISRLIG